MARKIISPVSGEEVEVKEMDFENSKEPWSEYDLEDGTKIKVKNVVKAIIRLVGEYDENGNPAYIVVTLPFVRVTNVPEKEKGTPTKRKEQKESKEQRPEVAYR